MSEQHTDPSAEQEIDKLYRSLSTEQPPASLDMQIREAAHHAVDDRAVIRASSRNIWLRSMAYAAVVVVGVSVVVEVSMQPEVMQTEPSLLIRENSSPAFKASQPDAEISAFKASPESGAKSEELRQRQVQRTKKTDAEAKRKARSQFSQPRSVPATEADQKVTELAAPAIEMMMQDEIQLEEILQSRSWRANPQLWIEYCQRLLRANNTDELAEELIEFRRQHKDYPLPQGLSEWLQQAQPVSKNP